MNHGLDAFSILSGDGRGDFAGGRNFPTGGRPYSIAVGDFNGDRLPDVAVTNSASGDITILTSGGTRSATLNVLPNIAAGQTPRGIATGDFDDDGRLDLAATDSSLNRVMILLNATAGNSQTADLPPGEAMIRPGQWGGRGVGLRVTGASATVEFDCAHGTIDGVIKIDRNGRFEVMGTYEEEAGGAVRSGISAQGEDGNVAAGQQAAGTSRRARYTGEVKGRSMKLVVTLTGSERPLGTYNLGLDSSPRLRKCR